MKNKTGTARAKTITAYMDLFSSDLGKLVLNDLIKSTRFLTTTHEVGDPYTSAFNEGQRALVARIIRTCNMNHEYLKEMLSQLNKEEF
jgi:hypothetical protein